MKGRDDSPTSVELTPRNLGILLGVTAAVIAVSFWLGARMSSGLAESAGVELASSGDGGNRPSLSAPPESDPDEAEGAPTEVDEAGAAEDGVGDSSGSGVPVEDSEGAGSGRSLGAEASQVLEQLRRTEESGENTVETPPAAPPRAPIERTSTGRPVPTPRAVPEAGPSAAPRSGGYTIQVEAGRSRQSAEDRAAELTAQGWTAFVQRADLQARGVYYRVRVGRFETREGASAELERLARSLGKPTSAFVVMAND